MCPCPGFIRVLILTIQIMIWFVTDVGYAKLFKTTDATQFTRAHVIVGRESLIRIPREATSEEIETTARPNIEESGNVGTETKSSTQYEDEVESSALSFSMESQELKHEKPNKTTSGLHKLLEFLKENKYNKYEIPKTNYFRTHFKYRHGSISPVYVRMYLSIRSVIDIDETSESVSLEVDIITEWVDGKLHEWYYYIDREIQSEYRQIWPEAENNPVPLESKVLENFWYPDISIRGLSKVTTSNILANSESLQFRIRGDFTYIKRMTVKVKCEMDFTYYPADTQKCDFLLRSYSYNSADLNLRWRQLEGVYLMETSDPNFDLQVVNVTRYSMSELAKKECYGHICFPGIAQEEEFHVLRFTLHMRRKIYYQLLQTYIPSALYIAITWLCFMIPRRMVEGRIAISMTTLLTLTASFASVRESTPKVSYVKAIDIWMAAGIFFIFLNLLEFAILLWSEAVKKDGKELEESGRESAEGSGSQEAAETENRRANKYVTFRQKLREWVHSKASIAIDFVEENSFELILIVTTSFNIAYWTWLFVKSEYFSWSLEDEHNTNAGYNKYEEKMGIQLKNYHD